MKFAEAIESRAGRAVLLLARVAFWAGAGLLAYALCRRGITLSDEGDVLSGALDILRGQVPYRDIDMFVTPGVWFLNAAVFALAGPSVIATRIAAAGCLLATMAVTRRIVRHGGGPLWGDFAAGLVAIFAVWAWPAWSWSFYSPWATLFSLAGLACTLEWMRSRRSAWLLACGAMLGLAIGFKQNYGVFAAAGCAVADALDEVAVSAATARVAPRAIARATFRAGLLVATGGARVLLPGVAWLAWQGALPAAFDLLVLRPFEGFIQSHSIAFVAFGDFWRRQQIWTVGGLVYMAVPVTATAVPQQWPGWAISLMVLQHVALYWIPVFAFAGIGAHAVRRLRHRLEFPERALLATGVFAGAYFLGVFPRADFNHLINVYQPVLAMLAMGAAACFGAGRWRASRLRMASAGGAAVVFVLFAGVAAVWMNDLRKTLWLPLEAERAGVLVDTFESEMLNAEIRLIRSLTAEDEPVFALPNLSMIPFLAERRMPTRYHNFYAVHIGQDHGLDAAREIEASGARVIVASYNNFFADPIGMLSYGHELSEYLRSNFRPLYSLGNRSRLVLMRRDSPLEKAPWRSLTSFCQVWPKGPPGTFVKEYLLFHSLYHSFWWVRGSYNQKLTTCEIKVPEQARLRFALELHQPGVATEPALVRSDIWLLGSRGRPRRLLDHERPLATEAAWQRDAGEEFEIDLSPWQGKTVYLLLRTIVDGKIPDAPLDHHGLSMMWNDLRLESPEYAPDYEPADSAPEPEEPEPADSGPEYEPVDSAPEPEERDEAESPQPEPQPVAEPHEE